MHDELRAALDAVHAEPELKAAARAAVARRARRKAGVPRPMRLALAAVVVLSGRWLYFTPTAQISIDINPSLELGINRIAALSGGTTQNGTATAPASESAACNTQPQKEPGHHGAGHHDGDD